MLKTKQVSAYIGLGSNLLDRPAMLQRALYKMHGHEGCRLAKVSSVYLNPPFGPIPQQDFLNAVVELRTVLTPEDLFSALKTIEFDLGRVATAKWGPRCIDLDILLMGDLVLESHSLTIPHAGLTQRASVLVPLVELEPDLVLPNGSLASSYITPEMHSLMRKTSQILHIGQEPAWA